MDSIDIRTIEYRKNDGEWTEITSDVDQLIVEFVVNDETYTGVTSMVGNKFNASHDGITVYFTAESLSEIAVGTNVYSDYRLSRLIGSMSSVEKTLHTSPSISVVNGDIIQFRGDNSSYYASTGCFNGTTCQFKLKGNIMSIISSTNFATIVSSSSFAFRGLFNDCTGLIDASNLILPAIDLKNYCYESMFLGCTSLTTAPELPATTLADYCYQNMFYGCSSLTAAPELPATTLANYCYASMFKDCTSLTTAPELPATTLATFCYQSMFQNCTSLNYIKAMFTTIPGANYTSTWVNNVSSTGTFVKNAAATWTNTGSNAVPTGWTVETATE